jgi:NAD+ kinase
MFPKKVLVVCYKKTYGTEDLIKNVLKKSGVKFTCMSRDRLSKKRIKDADLIITVGGDGTFLRTAQHVTNQLMFAVNTQPNKSEGFFSRATKSNFEAKFDLILNNKFKIVNLSRLESTIKYGKKVLKIEPAVNEVFIGNSKPYLTSRYNLTINNKREFQKSSGVIIATGAGSNSWVRSAGGKMMPYKSDKIQFVVREPYHGRLSKPKLTGSILPSNSVIRIISMDWHGIVAVDSHHHEHSFKEGASITVKKSKTPLRYIDF